jgi:N-acetylglutamate synthase-like GNAT family acetyltransferase
MIIRQANKFDLHYFINLIHRINDMDELGDIVQGELDDEHLNQLFATVLAGAGLCYIAESEERVGMILGVISPNMWAPKYLFMHQVLYWVEEEYRSTRAGYMLFKEFDKECQRLVDMKRVHHVTLSAPKTLIDMDFERFNYELSEKTWIKKGMRNE